MQTVEPIPTVASKTETRVFGGSLAISAIRCTLSYLVFPFVLPLVGITAGLDSGVGLLVGPIAIAANLFSMHRFAATGHRYRLAVCAVNATFIVLLTILLVGDARAVFG